jgi:two-component system response regulator AtoC
MKVLIVDDEVNIRTSLSQFFSVYDIDSELAENGLVAQRVLLSDSFDAMVVDLKMPGMDGLELIKWMREEAFDIPVIMVSAHGDIQDAVSALKGGVADYIVKPFNPEELVNKISKMVEANKVKQLVESDGFENSSFIGQSSQMLDIKKTIARCAKTKSNVLITGESGTGKGVVAKEIHRQSFGENGPFQSINIGGVPASLIESELFGHEKGAFTGAVNRKLGLFEVANGGTLFLDELGDLPLDLQVKLLTVLNDRQVQRLGDIQKRDINVRIIAATNKNLEKMVNVGTFREDLYFRLNVLRIKLPPLRERRNDIPLLAAGILRNLKREMGNDFITGFSPNALEKLKNGKYYGNVRELENVLERAILFCDEPLIHEDDLIIEDNVGMAKLEPTSPIPKSPIEIKSLKEVEKEKIIESLHRWAGNKTKASKELGISRRTLLNKLGEYDIEEFKKVK